MWRGARRWQVLALCLYQDMLVGVLAGVIGFQLYAMLFGGAAAAADASKKAQ